MSEAVKKLKVVYHEDHSTDVLHTRGEPVVCKDCRFAGWLTEYEYEHNKLPVTCLLYSGGADPQDGDRVKLDSFKKHHDYVYNAKLKELRGWRELYPFCSERNQDGQCSDYMRAKKLSWFARLFQDRRAMRK